MSCCGRKTNDDLTDEIPKKSKTCTKLVQCLCTCCLLWFIVSAVLVAALVFIGKHIVYNSETGTFSRYKPINFQNVTHGILSKPRNVSDILNSIEENNITKKSGRIPLNDNQIIKAADAEVKIDKKFRLPRDTKPILYNLTLLPFLETDNFNGHVKIILEVLNSRESIILNSLNLSISNVTLTREADGKVLPTLSLNEDQEEQQLIIVPKEKVSAGKYLLDISFQGKFKGLSGFYKSVYTRNDGTPRTIATSKFEPTYARQAFPCFDEPNMKAKYIIHLLKPKKEGYIALSNYPVEKTTSYDNEHDLVTFQETVSMSTYLTCFIVSDFISTETTFNNGENQTQVPLKIYASPGNLDKISYAAYVTKKVIEYYVEYFALAYPLPKLDLVAVPDFVSGAMENWGLITYRETALLYTNKTHSSSNKQRIASVIAHELAHSWFGNLVTMDWWNDLWLNEGFATYISFKGVDVAEEDMKMMSQFQLEELIPVLNYDSGLSSHPIVVEVNVPDQITSIFDTISYNKGASILRMLEGTVGEENFRKGVTNYLKKYAYKNAVTKNFLDEIQGVVGSKINIFEIMDTFTVQMGYPIINVTYDENTESYILTQKRFLKNPNATYDANESKYRYTWSIPLTYVTDLGRSDIIAFPYSQKSITIPKPKNSTWFKINSDQVGYYRVTYDEVGWKNLIDSYDELNVYDRTHVIEDTFSVASAGQLNYSVPLNLTKKLINELDYSPWSLASAKLLGILKHLNTSSSNQEPAMKTYIQRIINNAYENLTWVEDPNEPHIRKLTRVEVLNTACRVDHEQCLAEVTAKFNTWLTNPTQPLSQDLRGIIYLFGMKNATEETWNKLFDIYMRERDASEKNKLMAGLANVRDSTILKKLIDVAKNESVVRGQDYFQVLMKIAANPMGTELVWDFVRNEWEYLVNRFTLNERNLGNFIPALASRFSTEKKLEEFETFFKKYPEAGAGARGRKIAVENIKNNIRWLAQYKVPVEDWIKATVNES